MIVVSHLFREVNIIHLFYGSEGNSQTAVPRYEEKPWETEGEGRGQQFPRTFLSYSDVTMAVEGLRILGLYSAAPMTFKQGSRDFYRAKSAVLWHGASV